MSNPYVPAGVCILCNEGTACPKEIGIYRNPASTIHTNESAHLLTVKDKKLSDKLECRIAGEKWLGLQAIALVAAGGLFIFASVMTAGLACTVVTIAASFVTAVGLGAGIKGIREVSHACDATSEDGSMWNNFHPSVKFDGENALLKHSILACSKGGFLTLVYDKALAMSMGKDINDANFSAILSHTISEGTKELAFFLDAFIGNKNKSVISKIASFAVKTMFHTINYMQNEDKRVSQRSESAKKYLIDNEPYDTSHSDKDLSDNIINKIFGIMKNTVLPNIGESQWTISLADGLLEEWLESQGIKLSSTDKMILSIAILEYARIGGNINLDGKSFFRGILVGGVNIANDYFTGKYELGLNMQVLNIMANSQDTGTISVIAKEG